MTVRRLAAALAVALALAGFVSLPHAMTRAMAAPFAPHPEVVDAPHRVFMMTDSVGLGIRGVLQATLPEYQVVIDGFPALMVDQLEDRMLKPRVASNSADLGDTVIVAGGYNYPYWDPAGFDRDIDSMIATLRAGGVKNIIWVTLREVRREYVSTSAWNQIQKYSFYFPRVNQHLRDALDRHPDLVLADWAAIGDQPGLTYDAIHLNPTGAQLYSDMLAAIVRSSAKLREAGSTTPVTVAGLNAVPGDAKAVAVNLTVTTPRRRGFLTAWACGSPRPATSNLNFAAEQTVAVSAIVTVGAGGQICVFNSATTQVIVDVQGYYSATSSYQTVAPIRLVDTRTPNPASLRPANEALVVPVVGSGGLPGDARAVAVNVTVVDNTLPGYALVYPCDTPQTVPIALVNFIPGTATPNFGIVKPSADGTICVRSSTPANIIVDAFGYFPVDSNVVVTAPTRLADTRSGVTTVAPLTDVTVAVVGATGPIGSPGGAAAAVVTVTAASPEGVGWVVAYPCGTSPATSTLNVVTGRATTNTAIVAPGVGGAICVKANVATHILVDISAWIIDGYLGLTPWRALDTRLG